MEIRQDVQLQLLKELDDICEMNNLKYTLIGTNGLNAYLNQTIKNAVKVTSIAMPLGDIDRFCKIIEDEFSKDRYVEPLIENNNLSYVMYGNMNTTDFHILKVNNQVHNGINIRIYPMYPFRNLNGKTLPRKNLDKKITIPKSQNKFLKRIYGLLNYTTVKYMIDNWDDIQNFSEVRIMNTKFDSNIFNHLKKIETDNIKVSLPEDADAFFKTIFGINFKNRQINPSKEFQKEFLSAEVSYKEVIDKISNIITEVNELNDEIQESVTIFEEERDTVTNLWNLVKMTDEQINFIEYFKDKTDYLLTLDLNDEKQFFEVYVELEPVINSLKKYSKKGMTFSIDEKTDSLIEKVLIMDNKQNLVKKFKELSKKEYFVE